MKKYILCALLSFSIKAFSQIPHPINGVQDERHVCYALTQVTIHVNADEVIKNATILVQNGIITNVGSQIVVPQGAVVFPQNGKHLYPAFIDLWSGYGLPSPEGRKRRYDEKTDRDDAGPFAWNMAIHPEYEAVNNFSVYASQAASLRKAGFASVLSHTQDGIMRGTGVLVSLADKLEHQVILNPKPASFFSFDKGSSSQDYPSSLMGSIALLRQSFYDARWYAQGGKLRYTNQSLQAITDQEKLPAFFNCSNWEDALRVNKIGVEFGRKFIVFGTADAYHRVDEIKKAGLQLILPLQLPESWDVSDSYAVKHIPLSDMLHWEAAACNAAAMFKAGVPFAFSSAGLNDIGLTTEMLHKAVKAGLPAKEALRALTSTPAKMIAADNRIGQIKSGMEASFFLTNDTLFHPGNRIVQTWVQGILYDNEPYQTPDIRGKWNVIADGYPNLELNIFQTSPRAEGQISIENKEGKATIKLSGTRIDISVSHPELQSALRMNGSILIQNGTSTLSGKGSSELGAEFEWSATFLQAPIDSSKADTIPVFTIDSLKMKYPFASFGFDEIPLQENILFKNATVWTCENEGRLEQADVLVLDGKIAAIGKNLTAEKNIPKGISIKTLDATGKHITPGIVDEHSHIAITRGVNEGSQNNTAEVRIGDVVESTDHAIYYQLAGGVTSAQLLHGSANPIGGQSAIIKLRWGKTPEQMLNSKAPGHIKFALGENVKQSNWGDSKRSRFPQTRMGVEQVYFDAFQRAQDYMRNKELWEKSSAAQRLKMEPFRRDLELDAIVEIINGTRNITCHSYVQSEVNMLLHVADSMRFHVNTFTHILEGYKVADKIKAHGANASTFSDWWAYKFEVNDAIPYNAALLTKMGVNTGINSDDTEMGRRLNQEAAKAILYGGLSQEEALKLVTINPAKMLKIDGHTGSLKVGKDADFVVWNANPLSIVAKAEMTFIDGVRYYDSARNDSMQVAVEKHRNQLISKMLKGGSQGKKGRAPKVKRRHEYECEDLYNGELMEEEEIK